MKKLEAGLTKWVNISLAVLEKEIEAKSPVDTGDYISWNKRQDAKREWMDIVGSVYNDSKNSFNVEYWWRKSPVNRHKNRKQWWPVIHTWVGARVYTRTRDEKESLVKKILQNNIKYI